MASTTYLLDKQVVEYTHQASIVESHYLTPTGVITAFRIKGSIKGLTFLDSCIQTRFQNLCMTDVRTEIL